MAAQRGRVGESFELQRRVGEMRKKSVFLLLEKEQKRGITISVIYLFLKNKNAHRYYTCI